MDTNLEPPSASRDDDAQRFATASHETARWIHILRCLHPKWLEGLISGNYDGRRQVFTEMRSALREKRPGEGGHIYVLAARSGWYIGKTIMVRKKEAHSGLTIWCTEHARTIAANTGPEAKRYRCFRSHDFGKSSSCRSPTWESPTNSRSWRT